MVEDRLVRAAGACHMDPSVLAADLIERGLPDPRCEALADLMDRWVAEDATDDLEELARRDSDWDQIRAGLNANRNASGERPLFA